MLFPILTDEEPEAQGYAVCHIEMEQILACEG